MRSNMVAVNRTRTFEGAPARIAKPPQQLLRQVATCMLFENTFYEKGSKIAEEIAESCAQVSPEEIARVAILAREDFKLRHVPLFLLAQLDKRRAEVPGLLKRTVERVVQRPDELGETLAILRKVHAKEKPASIKKILSAGMKKGLALAFKKFSPYQLAKWNQADAIKLRDVLFLCHPKPKDDEQAAAWKALAEGTLESPDTWEVALSSGADKRETWERLLSEKKLGYIALLMNLRNMVEAAVNRVFVESALREGAKGSRALPFRFVSAAKHAPSFAQALSDAMVLAVEGDEKLRGTTHLMIDVSGSMDAPMSGKSTLQRFEAAAALGILLREVCESVRVFTFSNSLVEVANLRGLAMMAGIIQSQPHSGTALGQSLVALERACGRADRVIVVTDEQANSAVGGPPGARGYIVNVAPYKPGLDLSGGWTRINGFSERVVDWIRWEENPEGAASV